MIRRLGAVAFLLFALAACEPHHPPYTGEELLREKFSGADCYISNIDLPPGSKCWHSRLDCPDLQQQLVLNIPQAPAKARTFAHIMVRPQIKGVFDAKGLKYDLDHCPKCVN